MLHLSPVTKLAGAAGLAVLGLFLAFRFLGPGHGKGKTAPPQPTVSERKQIIKVDTGATRKAADEAAKKTDLRARAPRTLQDAKRLAGEGNMVEARSALVDVVSRDPGDVQAIALLKSVQDQIALREDITHSMSEIASAYKQERYEDSLRMLYRLPADMQRGDIELYKANAWYNNGRLFLLGGNCTEAIRCFDEALTLNPKDGGARRLKEYAAGYINREKDTAYLIYVESLPKRPMDER